MSVHTEVHSGPAALPALQRRVGCLLLCMALGLAAGCQSNPTRTGGDLTTADQGLFAWVDGALTPYLAEQLARHPRFKGEPVLLVAMTGADVLPDIDALSHSLRSRVMDSLLETPGVNLHWRPAVRPWRHHRRPTQADCRDSRAVHYFIGIDISPVPGGEVRARVRALDLRDETWVAGFSKHWQGRLSAAQASAWRQRHPDEYLRGLRVLPFGPDQLDLLAAYLAGNLSCLLRGDPNEERLVHLASPPGSDPQLRTTLELVENYLARFRAVRATDDASRAVLILQGKKHPIHGNLHQIWTSLRSREGHQRIDTEAYVRLNPGQRPGSDEEQPPTRAAAISTPLLSGLQLVSPREPGPCGAAVDFEPAGNHVAANDCVAVQVDVADDARLFLLRHSPDAGLRRLHPASCRRPQTEPGSGGRGSRLRIVTAPGEQQGYRASEAATLYAVAVSGSQLRRQVTAHMQQLASDCDAGRQSTGPRMDSWLVRLEDLLQTHPMQSDWQAVRIRYSP